MQIEAQALQGVASALGVIECGGFPLQAQRR
jgi:hypothetical protein